MAVDKEAKKHDELELYQIDEKAIMPFFREHLKELKEFLHNRKDKDLGLLVSLKQFIRESRQPFNMQRYMEVQRTFIQQSLTSMQDRQAAVSHWIQEHAGRHRDRMIQLQCLYLDRVKDKLLPEIEKLLEGCIESLHSKHDK